MKKPHILFRCVLFIISSFTFFTSASAQNPPGKRDSLYSEILKEERAIQVVLPENYKPGSAEKYDVLYILDGEWSLKFISPIQQFVQENAGMPPIIMVAVLNTNRDRDLLPTHIAQNAVSGGSDKFLAFLKSELIPHINKSYPATGNNILYGHSLGGLFAMYALLSEPQLFNSYLAVDPSFWWDDNAIGKIAADKLSKAALSGKSLFIAGREGDGLKQMGIPVIDAALKSKAPSGLNWKVVAYPDEHHGSVRLKGVYDGLKFFYEGYSNQAVEFHPMNGMILKDKPYKIYYAGSPEAIRSVHYTTDGSEPTASSARMEFENTFTNTANISAKALGRYDRYNKTTVGEFKIGNAPAASAKPKNAKPGGLHYSYYEGEWETLPDFEKLTPVKTGIANKDFALNKLPRQTNFGLVIDGHIEIKKEGYYIFALDSDDGSRLSVGSKQLIAYDGLHGNGSPKSYLVPLEKGFYPIRLEYFQQAGGASLMLHYVVPGEEKPHPVPVPFELQYSAG